MLKERMKSVPKKSVSKRGSERRKLKAKKRTERKRTELAPAPADQLAAPSYRARYTPIGEIKVDLGTRGPVIPEMVETLVTSIPVEGLLIPIMVKKEGDDIKLVSGLQRLEAMRILGWQEVPCIFIQGGENIAERVQIVENAQRKELTKLQKANQIAKWFDLTESLRRISGEKVQKKRGRPEGGNAKAARSSPVSGKSPEANRKNIAEGRKIGALETAVQEAIVEAGLDNNTGKLLKIVAEPTTEARLAKVAELAKPRKPEVSDPSDDSKNETTFGTLKGEWKKAKKLRLAWKQASPRDRTRFVTKVLKYGTEDD